METERINVPGRRLYMTIETTKNVIADNMLFPIVIACPLSLFSDYLLCFHFATFPAFYLYVVEMMEKYAGILSAVCFGRPSRACTAFPFLAYASLVKQREGSLVMII